MKNTVYILLLLICYSNIVLGQTANNDYWNPKYRNIGFINTTISQDELPDLKSNYGVNLSLGRTFYLHKSPVFGFIKFGLDVTWFDLSYTNYDIKHITYANTESIQMHEGAIGMQIGPSISLNPFRKMNIHTYCRYLPSYTCYYIDSEFQGNYNSIFIVGGSVSYGRIGLGIEGLFGKSKLKPLLPWNYQNSSDKIKSTSKGLRAFLTLRF